MTGPDVVVVGGGPAGTVAAIELARAGARVMLLEAKRYPRHKVCGDALIPDSLDALGKLGILNRVAARAHRPGHLRVFAPSGRSVRLSAPLLTIKRHDLDALLAEVAREAGATVIEGVKASGPVRGEGGAVAGVAATDEAGHATEIRAPLTILATGAASGTLAAFGVRTRSTPSAVAMRAYYEVPALDQDELIISYERPLLPGYAWIFPMGGGVANVGVGVFLEGGVTGENLRELFDRMLKDCPHTRDAMRGAREVTPLQGAPIRCSLTGAAPCAAGLLVAGEALGTTYALSGEGIGKAMASGRLAARAAKSALDQGRFDAASLALYEASLREAGFPLKFAQYDAAQRWVKHTAVVNLVAWRAARSPKLRAMLEAILREEVPPDELFSLSGLARALVG